MSYSPVAARPTKVGQENHKIAKCRDMRTPSQLRIRTFVQPAIGGEPEPLTCVLCHGKKGYHKGLMDA